MTNLHSKINIKNITIKNRIVLPPMLTSFSDNTGMVTEQHIDHYERIAKGGCGLIIIEAICVVREGRFSDAQLGLWSDSHIEGLNKIVEKCHKYGARVLVQLMHSGYNTAPSVSSDPIAPSSLDGKNARSMTLEELKELEGRFVRAAERARKAGFDGIELHGAHGFLLNQFVSPIANKRDDDYGGSLKNRARFGAEIISCIKKEVADDSFIVSYRIGGNEPTLENAIEIAKIFESKGLDLLHVSEGIAGDKLPLPPDNFPYNYIIWCGTQIRKHISIPVIVVYGIRTPLQAENIITENMADFTAVGKGQLADSGWANKARDGIKVIPYLGAPLFRINIE